MEVHLQGYVLGAIGGRHAHGGGQADLHWKRRQRQREAQVGGDKSGLLVGWPPWPPAHFSGKLVLQTGLECHEQGHQ